VGWRLARPPLVVPTLPPHSPLLCASRISRFFPLYISWFRYSSCSPSFHNLLCPTTLLKRKKRSNFPGAHRISRHRWAVDGLSFSVPFSSVTFSTTTLSDNTWVWPGYGRPRGVFLVTFFFHHHFIISLRAAVELKSRRKLGLPGRIKGFLKEGFFEND